MSSMEPPIIFVTGLPRSGTTWIGKIFDSHPDTLYRHEPDRRARLKDIPFAAAVDRAHEYRSVLREFVRDLTAVSTASVSAQLPIFRKSYYPLPKFAARVGMVVMSRLAARVFGSCPAPDFIDFDAAPQLRVVWKSVESASRAGVLARLIDRGRIILIVRHPCANVASLLRGGSLGRFDPRALAQNDLNLLELLLQTEQAKRYGLTSAAIREMDAAERLAWRWALINEKAIDDIAGLPNCRIVRYEDLCAAPIPICRDLFAFSELDWSAQTENFIRRSTSIDNPRYYSVFKNPLQSATKWRRELPADVIAQVMAAVGDTKPGRLFHEGEL